MREIIKQWSYVTTSNREDFRTSYFLRAADGFSKNNLVGTGIFGSVSRTGFSLRWRFLTDNVKEHWRVLRLNVKWWEIFAIETLLKSSPVVRAIILKQLLWNTCPMGAWKIACTLTISVWISPFWLIDSYNSSWLKVLLDENLVAHVSDSCIARLFSEEDQDMLQI